MASAKVIEQPRPTVVAMSHRDLARVFITGLIIGLVIYGLYIALNRYVFAPTLCAETGLLERCDNRDSYAATMAMLIGGFGGLFAMVKLRVYRPLLVAILATLTLWGMLELATTLSWWLTALTVAVIVAFAYTAFAWIVTVRNLYVALGLAGVLILAVQFILTA